MRAPGPDPAAAAQRTRAVRVAPLSTVQAVLSTGVVVLAVLGSRMFGHAVTRRQWIGVAMTATGLALLVVTLPAPDGTGSHFAIPGLVAFESATLVLGALLIADDEICFWRFASRSLACNRACWSSIPSRRSLRLTWLQPLAVSARYAKAPRTSWPSPKPSTYPS